MDFSPSSKSAEYLQRLLEFMDGHVYPAEPVYAAQRAQLVADDRLHEVPAVIEELKVEARLTEADPRELATGMEMELVLVPFRTDEEGNEVVTFAFRPVK